MFLGSQKTASRQPAAAWPAGVCRALMCWLTLEALQEFAAAKHTLWQG